MLATDFATVATGPPETRMPLHVAALPGPPFSHDCPARACLSSCPVAAMAGRSRSTTTPSGQTRALSTRSVWAETSCTRGRSRPAPSARCSARMAPTGPTGPTRASTRHRRPVRRAGRRGDRRDGHGAQHVRPDPWLVGRRAVEGLVRRRPALPPSGVRAHPPPAGTDPDDTCGSCGRQRTPLGTCSAATRGPVVRGCSRRRPRARRTRRACGRRSACRGA
jgi:hypothetical protein